MNDPVLELNDATIKFGGLTAVSAFNLRVAFGPRLRARWRRQFAAMYGGAVLLVAG